MKTGFVISSIAVVTVGLCASASSASAATVTVNTTVDEITDGRCSLMEAQQSLGNGVGLMGCTVVASTEEVINLPAGTHNTNGWVVIGAPSGLRAHLKGAGVGTTIINARGPGNSDAALYVPNAQRISNLTIRASSLTNPMTGIRVGHEGDIQLDRVRITGFNASGILNQGFLEVVDSTIDLNVMLANNGISPAGGGLFNDGGIAMISRSTFNGNRAPSGGAIYVGGNQVWLSQSTIVKNVATGGRGGGVHVSALAEHGYAECNGNHVTVAYNTSTQGGAGVHMGPATANGGTGTAGTSTRWNASIIALNTRNGTASDYQGVIRGDRSLQTTDGLEKNLVGNLGTLTTADGWNRNDFIAVGDFVGNPQFVTTDVASNGGPTKTIALRTSTPRSPAIDAGRADHQFEDDNFSGIDQRGLSAPIRSRYDLGAYEAR